MVANTRFLGNSEYAVSNDCTCMSCCVFLHLRLCFHKLGDLPYSGCSEQGPYDTREFHPFALPEEPGAKIRLYILVDNSS